MARFKELPLAPAYISGLLVHRDQLVPVVDLTALAGRGPSRPLLSTRVILVRFTAVDGRIHLLGLVAEQVTDTISVSSDQARPNPIQVARAPYLGELFAHGGELVQVVQVDDLVPSEVQALLFPMDNAAWTSAS